ncbi:hypothetical protein PsYK624_053120 [Phanerochaete sordida]|uniref:Uncharacterized protein n=1 Tax=Phanerochaete sordida TaxID=48140 RepID=A0A9P3LCU3_9APHY|nr:hypothetical protein PsYK624_053120 [Phanerochaete sordida]
MHIPLFSCRYILAFFTFVHLCPALGALINVTVDDQGSDSTTGTSIVYEAQWAIGPCSTCGAQPDPNNAIDGTWHDTTYNPSVPAQTLLRNATFEFTGSALYVFGMIDGGFGIDLILYLDGEQAGRFTDPPTSDFTYKYNQLYFSAENLDETQHSFKLQNGENNGPLSVVLFDYLRYTKDDGSEPSSVPPPASPAPSPQSSNPPTPEQPPTSSTPTSTSSKPPQGPDIPSSSPSGNSTSQTSTSPATSPPATSGDVHSTAPLFSPASSTSVVTVPDSSSRASPSPSSPGVAAASSHAPKLSNTTRTAVIAVAVVVPIIILALLALLYRARRSRFQRGTSTENLVHSPSVDANASEGRLAQLADMAGNLQTPPYADTAPTYYSVSPFTPSLGPSSQTSPLLPEKGRAPASATFSSPSVSGHSSVQDAEMSEVGEGAIPANMSVWDPVGSVTPETAPPMYQSEA